MATSAEEKGEQLIKDIVTMETRNVTKEPLLSILLISADLFNFRVPATCQFNCDKKNKNKIAFSFPDTKKERSKS